jgi:chromosome segregation ATPase
MSMSQSRLRQHRWELDERRRFLAGLEALAARLRRDAQRLHWEIEEETGAGRSEQKTGVVYPIFVEPLLERRKKLERSIADIEAQIIGARETVATAEQELTLHEAAWANRGKGNAAAARRLRR